MSYLDDLTSVGCSVNARETTYRHLLTGPGAVLRWIFVVAQRTANRT